MLRIPRLPGQRLKMFPSMEVAISRGLRGGCGLLSVQDFAGLTIELEEVAGHDWRNLPLILC